MQNKPNARAQYLVTYNRGLTVRMLTANELSTLLNRIASNMMHPIRDLTYRDIYAH